MTSIPVSLKRELIALCGADALLESDADLAFYGSDRCRGGWPVRPLVVVRPADTRSVASVVRLCAEHQVAIVPSGGRTGLTGAATATNGELVLSLERMSRIHEVSQAARLLRCEAGATVQAVQEAAAAHGLFYPVDFASKGSAQIGGMVATNAGGVRVLRYGSTRQWVAGLEVVLASGEVVELGGDLVKDNAGYDLRHLVIGSEGTLAIITGVTLNLCAPPIGTLVALCALPGDDEVARLFARVRRSTLVCSAFECFDEAALVSVLRHRRRPQGPFDRHHAQHVLVEIEGDESVADELMGVLAKAQEEGEVVDAVLGTTSLQKQQLWAWREDVSESLHAFTPHKADISVPVARVMPFLAEWKALVSAELPHVQPVVFGHVGDGNLHLNLLCPDHLPLPEFLAEVHAFDEHAFALVSRFGGSISAEHGIGLLKREHLHFSRTPTEIALMKAVKAVLDPTNLLNPGKVFL